jgi:hypothetical protein
MGAAPHSYMGAAPHSYMGAAPHSYMRAAPHSYMGAASLQWQVLKLHVCACRCPAAAAGSQTAVVAGYQTACTNAHWQLLPCCSGRIPNCMRAFPAIPEGLHLHQVTLNALMDTTIEIVL